MLHKFNKMIDDKIDRFLKDYFDKRLELRVDYYFKEEERKSKLSLRDRLKGIKDV